MTSSCRPCQSPLWWSCHDTYQTYRDIISTLFSIFFLYVSLLVMMHIDKTTLYNRHMCQSYAEEETCVMMHIDKTTLYNLFLVCIFTYNHTYLISHVTTHLYCHVSISCNDTLILTCLYNLYVSSYVYHYV